MNVFRWVGNAVENVRAAWAAPKRRPSRVYVKPRLEGLEERWCPSTTWTDGAGTGLASNPGNWSSGLPTASNQAVLDGNVSKDSITFDAGLPSKTITCNGILVQNGYNGTMTIADGVTVKDNSVFNVKTGTNLTMKVGDTPMQLITGSSVWLDGILNLTSTGSGHDFMTSDGTEGISVFSDGTLQYTGQADTAPLQDELEVPVLNGGNVILDGKGTGGSGALGSTLYINAEGLSVSQSLYNDGGTVSLKGNTELICRYGYLQDATNGGITQTTDGYAEAIYCGNTPAADPSYNFQLLGGSLKTAPGGTTYDNLTIYADSSEIGATAEVDEKVNAANFGNEDHIFFKGGLNLHNDVTWDSGSKFVVNVNGTLSSHGSWGTLLSADAAFTGAPTLVKNGTNVTVDGTHGRINVGF